MRSKYSRYAYLAFVVQMWYIAMQNRASASGYTYSYETALITVNGDQWLRIHRKEVVVEPGRAYASSASVIAEEKVPLSLIFYPRATGPDI